MREHLELRDRDAAVELAVGRVVEEVEAALECTGLVGLLAEDRGGGGGRRGGAAEEPGHGAGLGQAHRRGVVDEGLQLLGGDDAVVVRVDVVEVVVLEQVVDRLCPFDRGDGIADGDPGEIAGIWVPNRYGGCDWLSPSLGSATGTAVQARIALIPSGLL